jgi:hypothetical protein
MESSSNPSTGSVASDASSAVTRNAGLDVPKFGEWEKHSVNSGPCYTLLFQNAAQEMKVRLAYWAKVNDSVASTPKLVELLPPENTPMYVYAAESKGSIPEAEAALATELMYA